MPKSDHKIPEIKKCFILAVTFNLNFRHILKINKSIFPI